MNESLVFHADELDGTVRGALEEMLVQAPDEQQLHAALDRLHRLHPPTRGVVLIRSERIRRSVAGAIAAMFLMALLWTGAQTTVWGQVSEKFQRAGQDVENPQPFRVGARQPLPDAPARSVPVGPMLRFVLILHVFSLLAGYLGFLLAWGNCLRIWLTTVWRGAVSGTMLQGRRLNQIGLVLYGTGVVLGGVWAIFAWGRMWDWDPREAFGLLTIGVGLLWYCSLPRNGVDSADEIIHQTVIASVSWWLMMLMYALPPLFMPGKSYGQSTVLPTVIACLLAVNLLLVIGSRWRFRRTI